MVYLNTVDVFPEIYDPFGKVETVNPDAELVPQEVADWLVQLRLLYGVPFEYLVPRADMLPPESVRFFYLDRNWTDRLVDGALSVGKTTTREFAHHHHLNDAILDRLDMEEHVYRKRLRGEVLESNQSGGVITGMLFRSAAVSSYPGLEVRAFSRQTTQAEINSLFENPPAKNVDQMKLLRMDRLSPNIMLCLWLGIPKLVRFEEPREGIQFGVDVTYTANNGEKLQPNEAYNDDMPRNDVQVSVAVDLRYVRDTNPNDASDNPGRKITGKTIEPVIRNPKRRVLDIEQLPRLIDLEDDTDEIGTRNTITSAEIATQLLKFPYFQSFYSNPPQNLQDYITEQEDGDPFVSILSTYQGANFQVINMIGSLHPDLIQAIIQGDDE